jgi:predicted O-methyltransferase YrrM
MNLKDALEISTKIRGWYDENELASLWKMCTEAVRKDGILEVGCFAGRSSSVLAQFVRTLQFPVQLTFVDPFLPEFMNGMNILSAKKEFTRHLGEIGVPYTLIEKRSIDAAVGDFPESIDFLHIDGDHRRVGVETDCFLLLPRVRLGGIVCFHDYGRPGFEVQAVVDDLCSEWEVIGTFGTVRALQKRTHDVNWWKAVRGFDSSWQ